MADTLQLRGGTTSQNSSFTGSDREVTVDTTKKTLIVHDGSVAGGFPLMKESGGNAASSVGIGTGGTNAINIDSSQRVGIGTYDWSNTNSFMDDFVVENTTSGSGAGISIIANATNGYSSIALGDTADKDAGRIQYNHSTNHMDFHTNGTGTKLTIDDNGSVGVGVTSPPQKLTVSGNAAIVNSGGIQIVQLARESDKGKIIINDDQGVTRVQFKTDDVSYFRGGNVGIGTNSPDALLHLKDNNPYVRFTDAADASHYSHIGSTADSVVIIDADVGDDHAGSAIQFKVDNGNVMTLKDSGSVGIGTTTPNSIFNIKSSNPDVILENTGTGTGQLRVGHFTNGAFIGTYADDDGNSDIIRFGTHSGDEVMRIHNNKNIGIGTPNPGGRLHIVTGGGSSSDIKLGTNQNTTSITALVSGSENHLALKSNDNTRQNLLITGDKIGINFVEGGTPSSPTEELHVLGDILASGTVTQNSDITLKKDVEPLQDCLNKVTQLLGINFTYKSNNEKSMGLVAQDVEKVFPELIRGEEGNKSLNYMGLTGALIEAIKELSTKVAALETK